MANLFAQIIPAIKEKMSEDKFSRLFSCTTEITCENAKLLVNELQNLTELNNNLVKTSYENGHSYTYVFTQEIKLGIKDTNQSDEYDRIAAITFFKDETTNKLSGNYRVNKFKGYHSDGKKVEYKYLKFNDLCIVKTEKNCFKSNE